MGHITFNKDSMLRNYQWALFSRRCRLNKLFSRASLDVFVFCKLCRCPHQLDSPLCFLKISMVTRFYHFSKISYFSLIFFFSFMMNSSPHLSKQTCWQYYQFLFCSLIQKMCVICELFNYRGPLQDAAPAHKQSAKFLTRIRASSLKNHAMLQVHVVLSDSVNNCSL